MQTALQALASWSVPIPEEILYILFMLNNYVVQHIGSASMTARFGSFAIFLLLNDSGHDPHFSACQNIETLDGIQKISNFSLYRFSRYSTPNMALQKIILTSFVKLKNYVFELNGFASVPLRFGSRKIFLLLNDFFSMSKYRNSRPYSKNFKIFSPQVFQIFDSKHGTPENYSDFFLC